VGDTTLTLANPVTGWQPGDRLVLPDSRQLTWSQQGTAYSPEWETLTIKSISADGTVLTLSQPLQFDHPGARDVTGALRFLPDVMDLTRNVVVASQNALGTRGYAMFTGQADVNIQYTQFTGLGRTTNANLDPTTYDTNGNVTHIGTNQPGRYPVYMNYLNGPASPQADGYQFTFVGNSIFCPVTPMTFVWGLAIQGSSHGLIQGNDLYNWAGAGIVTADGTETANVIQDNFVVRITGLGERADGDTPATGLARGGSAFWFSGPDNIVVDNVAADVVSPDPNDSFGYTIFDLGMNFATTPIREFSGNEAYGVLSTGLTYWWIGSMGNDVQNVGPSVIKDFHVWNFAKMGIFNYPSNHIVIDGLVAIDDQNISEANHNTGFVAGDYLSQNLLITNADIEGVWTGVMPSMNANGVVQTIENSFLACYHDIWMQTINTSSYRSDWIQPRTVIVSNVTFDLNDISAQPYESLPPSSIWMDYEYAPNDLVENLIVTDQLLVYNYDGVAGDNFQVYYNQQAPNYVVPQTIRNSDGTANILGAPVAGLTNQQAWDTYGIAIAGAVAPSTSTQRKGIIGLVQDI
jgi:hypothetical protein